MALKSIRLPLELAAVIIARTRAEMSVASRLYANSTHRGPRGTCGRSACGRV